MDEENSVFDIPLPDHDGPYETQYMPTSEEIGFKLKLIQIIHNLERINIDNDLKEEIISFIDPILTSASLTNIAPIQIREFLREWDLKMITIKIDYPDSKTPEFFRVMRNIRIQLKLQLNMAKSGWRGDHAFETHTKARYDVRQQQEQTRRMDRYKNFWKKQPPKEEME